MEDNPDSLVNQEVLTPGQLFLMFLKVSACCFLPGSLHGVVWLLSSSVVVYMLIISSFAIFPSLFLKFNSQGHTKKILAYNRFRIFFLRQGL
jgi:hypothetical protein